MTTELQRALAWVDAGKSVILASVVQTWGSAPRPVGALMAFTQEMDMAGSVSGGCVENAVVEEAGSVLESGQPRILTFGVSTENAFEAGLACGGEIRVLLDPVGTEKGLPVAMLRALVETQKNRNAVALLTNIITGEHRLGHASDADISERFVENKSGFEGDWFVGVQNPPLRLFIVGAVHIAQSLVKIAKLAGFDVAVIDPREAFANPTRFPDTRLILEWPDDALKAQELDSRAAVVTLTHDPKLDDPALVTALGSDVFYVGSLGSRRTQAKRVERLRALGVSQPAIHRIHGPVGLAIDAKTPAEISISIMAEITQVLRMAKTGI